MPRERAVAAQVADLPEPAEPRRGALQPAERRLAEDSGLEPGRPAAAPWAAAARAAEIWAAELWAAETRSAPVLPRATRRRAPGAVQWVEPARGRLGNRQYFFFSYC